MMLRFGRSSPKSGPSIHTPQNTILHRFADDHQVEEHIEPIRYFSMGSNLRKILGAGADRARRVSQAGEDLFGDDIFRPQSIGFSVEVLSQRTERVAVKSIGI